MKSTAPIALVGALILTFAVPAWGESPNLSEVILETSNEEISAPGLLGVVIRIVDEKGRAISPHRLPPDWHVTVTLNGTTAPVVLDPASAGPWLEGELLLRKPGRHELRGRITSGESIIGESVPSPVAAIARLDFGTVRAGETVCQPLSGNARGLVGKVIGAELPRGLRLWGGCLVADDNMESGAGETRAEIIVQAGRRIETRLYDIRFETESRFFTPRRIFYGFALTSVFAMLAFVMFSLRRRRPSFSSDTTLSWASLESSPYRGGAGIDWHKVPLGEGGIAVDLSALEGLEGIDLWAVPTDEGLIELIGSGSRESALRATTPDGRVLVDDQCLSVPYDSIVTYRSRALVVSLGESSNLPSAL